MEEEEIKREETPSSSPSPTPEKQKKKKDKKKHHDSEDTSEATEETATENTAGDHEEEEGDEEHHHHHHHHHHSDVGGDDDEKKSSKKSKKKASEDGDEAAEEKKKSHKKKGGDEATEKKKKSKKKDEAEDGDDGGEDGDDEKCSVEIAFDIMVISSCRMNGVDLPKEKSYSIKANKSTGSFMSALCKKEKLLRPDLYELFDPTTNKVVHDRHTFADVLRSHSAGKSKQKRRIKLVLRLSEVLDSDGEDNSGSKSASTGSSRSASSGASSGGRKDDASSCSSGSTAVSGMHAGTESRSMASRGGPKTVPASGYYKDSKENKVVFTFGSEKVTIESPEYIKFRNGFASNYAPDVTATTFLLGEQHATVRSMPNLRWFGELRKKVVIPMTRGVGSALPAALRNLGLGGLTRDRYVRIPPRVMGTQGDRFIPGIVVRDTSNTMIQAKTRVLIWCHDINDTLEASIPQIKEYSSGGKIDVISFEYRGRGVRAKEAAWRDVSYADLLDDLAAVVYHALRFWPSASFVLYGNGLGADLALNFAIALYSLKEHDQLSKVAKEKLSVVVADEARILPETLSYADRFGEIVSLPIIFASFENNDVMRTMPAKFKFVHPFFKVASKSSQEITNAIVTKIVDFMATMDSERQKRSSIAQRGAGSAASGQHARGVSAGVAQSSFIISGDLKKAGEAIEKQFKGLKDDDTESFRMWLRRRGFDAMLTESVIAMGARSLQQFVALYANEKPEPDNADYVKLLAFEGAWGLTLCTESWKDIKTRFGGFAKTKSFAERPCRVAFAELPRNWHVSAAAIRSMTSGSMGSFPTFSASGSSTSSQRYRKDTSSRHSSNMAAAAQSNLRKSSMYSGDNASQKYSSSSSESSSSSGSSATSGANTEKHRKSHHHKH